MYIFEYIHLKELVNKIKAMIHDEITIDNAEKY